MSDCGFSEWNAKDAERKDKRGFLMIAEWNADDGRRTNEHEALNPVTARNKAETCSLEPLNF
jgi:hypothetical protein